MSNRLSIEVKKIIPRSTGKSYNEIAIFDDYETKSFWLNQDEPPIESGELLLYIFKAIREGNFDAYELIKDHIQQSTGIDIEDDWIEWNDPRLENALKYWNLANN